MRSGWFWHGQVSSKGTAMGSLCVGNAGRCEPVLLKLPWLSHGPDAKRWSARRPPLTAYVRPLCVSMKWPVRDSPFSAQPAGLSQLAVTQTCRIDPTARAVVKVRMGRCGQCGRAPSGSDHRRLDCHRQRLR